MRVEGWERVVERAKSRLEKTVVLQVVQMRRSRERSLGGFSERRLVVVGVLVLESKGEVSLVSEV